MPVSHPFTKETGAGQLHSLGPTRAPGQSGFHWEFLGSPPQKNLLLKINLIGRPTNRKSHLCKETCLLILKKRNRNKAEKKKRPSFYISSVSPRVKENGTSYHGLISFGSNVVLRMAWSGAEGDDCLQRTTPNRRQGS